MAILENTTDYSTGDQLTAANLNALTESAKFVLAGSGVASTGNTTDETTLTVNGTTGELQVKDGGVDTTQIADASVTTAKIAALAVGTAKLAAGAVTNAKLGADCVTEAEIADGAVESEHLNDNVISGQTETTDEPADTDELLFSDAGTLKRIDVDDFAKCRFFPQAYGTVTWDGSATGTNLYNCTVADASTPTRITVTFSNAMADANYSVMVTFEDDTTATPNAVMVYARAAGSFDILSDASQNANRSLHFVVFGNRA